MRSIYFEDFRQVVVRHAREIEETLQPEPHSTEWFLLKYLRRIVKVTGGEGVSPSQVEGTVRSLIRFYVDNIDENSDTGERCTHIYEEYRRTLREHQEKK